MVATFRSPWMTVERSNPKSSAILRLAAQRPSRDVAGGGHIGPGFRSKSRFAGMWNNEAAVATAHLGRSSSTRRESASHALYVSRTSRATGIECASA